MHRNYLVKPNALVLAKIARNIKIAAHARAMKNLLTELVNDDLLTEAQETYYGSERSTYTLTDSGVALARMATPTDVVNAEYIATTVQDRIFTDLWFSLLMNGEHGTTYYGSGSALGERLEVLHILSCGLDREKSSTPEDHEWSEFMGTFAEGEDKNGIIGSATCNCGKIEDVEICMETGKGLAEMFKNVMNPSSMLP